MGSAPLIGLTGRSKKGSDVSLMPKVLQQLDLDVYFSNYAQSVLSAGGLPVYLPMNVDPIVYAHRLDGVLLSGGADVDPARFGHESETDLFPPEPARDELEFQLLKGADEAGIPVLGICRGIQVMNVHAGGTLQQHAPEHSRYDLGTTAEVHEVRFDEGSLAADIYGETRTVNSLHHQTVDEVAPRFTITGRSPDGSVEVIETSDRLWLGVQWHPEMMLERDSDPVFRWLVDAAS